MVIHFTIHSYVNYGLAELCSDLPNSRRNHFRLGHALFGDKLKSGEAKFNEASRPRLHTAPRF
jgi:hypothetical protein